MPRKSVFIITWFLILVYLVLDFYLKADRTFLPLNYTWKELTLIETIEDVTIDTVSLDYLRINSPNDLINKTNTFCLELERPHYFRTTSVKKTDSTVAFIGLKWLNGTPNLNTREITLQIVDLPLKQKGNITVTTIGDSQMLWRDGREFRKNLSMKNKSLYFKGENRDVYGYPCEAEIFVTTKKIEENIKDIKAVQNYILFFGAHDKNKTKEEITESVRNIFKTLSLRKKTQKVLVITLPPSPVLTFEEHNKKFNNILKKCANDYKKIVIVDLYKQLSFKKEYLRKDNVHLNKYGHNILSKLILKSLE